MKEVMSVTRTPGTPSSQAMNKPSILPIFPPTKSTIQKMKGWSERGKNEITDGTGYNYILFQNTHLFSPRGVWNEKQSFGSYYLDEKFPINSWSGSLLEPGVRHTNMSIVMLSIKIDIFCVKWNWKQNGNRKGEEKNNFVRTVELIVEDRKVSVSSRGKSGREEKSWRNILSHWIWLTSWRTNK